MYIIFICQLCLNEVEGFSFFNNIEDKRKPHQDYVIRDLENWINFVCGKSLSLRINESTEVLEKQEITRILMETSMARARWPGGQWQGVKLKPDQVLETGCSAFKEPGCLNSHCEKLSWCQCEGQKTSTGKTLFSNSSKPSQTWVLMVVNSKTPVHRGEIHYCVINHPVQVRTVATGTLMPRHNHYLCLAQTLSVDHRTPHPCLIFPSLPDPASSLPSLSVDSYTAHR